LHQWQVFTQSYRETPSGHLTPQSCFARLFDVLSVVKLDDSEHTAVQCAVNLVALFADQVCSERSIQGSGSGQGATSEDIFHSFVANVFPEGTPEMHPELEKEALKRAISIMHHKFAGDNMEIYDGDDGNPIEPEDDEVECRENLFERGSMGPLGPLAQHHELAMVVAVEFSKFLCLTYDVSPPLSTSIKKRKTALTPVPRDIATDILKWLSGEAQCYVYNTIEVNMRIEGVDIFATGDGMKLVAPEAKKAGAKKTPVKKTPAKKMAEKKAFHGRGAGAKKSPAKKTPAKKMAAKKMAAKKAGAKKSPAKKTPANKMPIKKTIKK